jgi:peptidoglycan/LPS O-acetylase OafA/YrhL
VIAHQDSDRTLELDGLRGLAIDAVLIFQYFVLTANAPFRLVAAYIFAFGRLSWSRVDLFFVSSLSVYVSMALLRSTDPSQ